MPGREQTQEASSTRQGRRASSQSETRVPQWELLPGPRRGEVGNPRRAENCSLRGMCPRPAPPARSASTAGGSRSAVRSMRRCDFTSTRSSRRARRRCTCGGRCVGTWTAGSWRRGSSGSVVRSVARGHLRTAPGLPEAPELEWMEPWRHGRSSQQKCVREACGSHSRARPSIRPSGRRARRWQRRSVAQRRGCGAGYGKQSAMPDGVTG